MANKKLKKEKSSGSSLKNKKQFRVACLVSSIFLGISILLFYIFLIFAKDWLVWYYSLLLFVIVTLLGFCIAKILMDKKFKLWLKLITMIFGILLSLIAMVGSIYGIYTLNNLKNSASNMKPSDTLTEEYYVIVRKDSKITKVEQLLEDDKIIYTFNEGQQIYDDAIANFKSLGDYNLEEVSSIDEMVTGLLDGETDAIIMSSFHKALAEEHGDNEEENLKKDEFRTSTEVIYTISVDVKKQPEQQEDNKIVDVTKDTFTIYISGIDTYGSISNRSRSDVNMLVTVNPKTNQILLVSIPRDYYVQLNGTVEGKDYKDKLTHAGIYGIEKSVKTIEDFMDIKIDFNVRVNFSTLVKIVDKIGGIDVYSDTAFIPWTNQSLYIPKGMVHMDGAMALAFARERKIYSKGDIHRVKNQQDVIAAIIKKVSSAETLLLKANDLINELSSSFETTIELTDIQKLVKLQQSKMPTWKIEQYSLTGFNGSDYTYSAGQQKLYVMIPDSKTIEIAKKYISLMEEGKEITISDEDKTVSGTGYSNVTSKPTTVTPAPAPIVPDDNTTTIVPSVDDNSSNSVTNDNQDNNSDISGSNDNNSSDDIVQADDDNISNSNETNTEEINSEDNLIEE